MSETAVHQTQIYLVTPGRVAQDSFAPLLAELMDEIPIAAVRLNLETRDTEAIAQAADAMRGICHARDVPLILSDHFRMVRTLGLDGVHLTGIRDLREARKELPDSATIGTFCDVSKHAGMTAGEIGADYVSFGPVSQSELGSAQIAEQALFEWWGQMIEVPIVAEGGMTLEMAEQLAPHADFIALGREVWASETSPKAALEAYAKALGLI